MILLKLIGIILIAIGFLILRYFPTKEYQRSSMTSTGIWLSLIILLAGIVMLVFA